MFWMDAHLKGICLSLPPIRRFGRAWIRLEPGWNVYAGLGKYTLVWLYGVGCNWIDFLPAFFLKAKK